MSSTTVEEQRELVSRPDTQLLFMARRSELRLTLKSRYPIRGPHGQIEGMTQGQYVGFRDGVFRCPSEGTVTLVDTLDGGEAEIEAEELVRRLKTHRLFGNPEEGFWMVDPVAPPPSKEEMKTLVRLAQRANVAGLEELLAQERDGWNRPDFIEAAEDALQVSREVAADLAAEAEREVVEAPTPKRQQRTAKPESQE